jgi:hypothetical protein
LDPFGFRGDIRTQKRGTGLRVSRVLAFFRRLAVLRYLPCCNVKSFEAGQEERMI